MGGAGEAVPGGALPAEGWPLGACRVPLPASFGLDCRQSEWRWGCWPGWPGSGLTYTLTVSLGWGLSHRLG